MDAKRLLFAATGQDHSTVQRFAQDLAAHGGKAGADPARVHGHERGRRAGRCEVLAATQISYDRFHVLAQANEAMDEARSAEYKQEAARVKEKLGPLGARERCSVLWPMQRNPSGGSATQSQTTHWLQRANLKSTRAWRLKMGLRQLYAQARLHGDPATSASDLTRWIGWARRSRLESFKRLGPRWQAISRAVVRDIFEHRTNAFVEAMSGLLQQAKRAARGFRNAATFISIAYLHMGKLTHLPTSPFVPAMPRNPPRLHSQV